MSVTCPMMAVADSLSLSSRLRGIGKNHALYWQSRVDHAPLVRWWLLVTVRRAGPGVPFPPRLRLRHRFPAECPLLLALSSPRTPSLLSKEQVGYNISKHLTLVYKTPRGEKHGEQASASSLSLLSARDLTSSLWEERIYKHAGCRDFCHWNTVL